MKKDMTYNTRPVLHLDTLLGIIQTSCTLWYDRPEKFEKSLKSKISICNTLKNEYNLIFNNEKFIAELPVGYIKHTLSFLNKKIKEVEKYKLPWYTKQYIDFVKERFTELMIIYKKGGWDKQ